jgi:cytidylate kinase
LASRLGIPYLDTGAMFRVVTYSALRRGIHLDDEAAVAALAGRLSIRVTSESVSVDGVDVTQEIRSSEVNAIVSHVAALSSVRSILREQQRVWAESNGGGVVEGRDIGTVVFPDATLKVFLTARPEIRAARRVAEAGGDVDEVARSIAERDRLDSSRQDSPLARADGSVIVDTSDLSIPEVVELLAEMVAERETRNG